MNKPSSPHQISRRDFVKVVTAFLGSVMGSVIGLPALGYLIAPATRTRENAAWIPLGPLQDYPIGVPKPFNFNRSQVNGWEKTVNSYGVFVIRKDENQVMVLSNICTHLACRVSWHPDIEHYVSPCHNGHFDVVGNVVSGPPPRPLDEFTTKIENGNLYIQYPPYKRS
jgi:Rieske Fe-S protein